MVLWHTVGVALDVVAEGVLALMTEIFITGGSNGVDVNDIDDSWSQVHHVKRFGL